MENRLKRVHLLVSGDVQGVGFRWWIKKKAIKLGNRGWVRNLGDGRVEIVAEGKKKDIEKMIELTKLGPRFSKVTQIDSTWEEVTSEFKSFEIVRD